MLARRFASASAGISYPYLYRNSAASPCALCAKALASAMEPVMTQPTEGEILKMWETEAGSISLSCKACQCEPRSEDSIKPYGNLFLRQNHGAIFSADAYRHDVCCCNCLESVLCCSVSSQCHRVDFKGWRLAGGIIFVRTYRLDRDGHCRQRW